MSLSRSVPYVDSISLLIGAEANKERRRSSRANDKEDVHRRLPRLVLLQRSSSDNTVNSDEAGGEQNDATDAEPSPGFLGRSSSVTSFSGLDIYNRLMHAHTKSQLASPAVGTIPTYTKTMHAHTLHQLHQHRRSSRSEASSPTAGLRGTLMQAKLCGELDKLSPSEVEAPAPPLNTPDSPYGTTEMVVGLDFGKLRKRSLTTPYGARDLAAVDVRDFAVSSAI